MTKFSGWLAILFKWLLLLVVLFGAYQIPPVHRLFHEMLEVMLSLDVHQVKTYLLSFGILAPIISFLLMMLSVLAPIPTIIITFANAMLFGWWQGALLSWASSMAGATLCFYISRWCGRDVATRLISHQALGAIDRFFARHGQYAILIARLLPFISFKMVSYAAGLTSMSLWHFFWASALGELPATLIYSWVGGMLSGGMRNLVIGLLCLFALSVFFYLLKQILNQNKSEKIEESQSV
ncbi:TVP38/TMEM64 family protein [Dongshaea marina]|uniref:TVP38/TMEM64 family protein n=1 Tax=Dongshaea marina TaxID=2047966 RepID=UPI001900C34D|nr:TVP38/TMEM64 family protein [Dongshaea marina]